MNENIIHIDWDGPYSFSKLDELKNDKIDYGIYQIYGGHPVYGSNKLLYIGKADTQTFGVRISQERWYWNNDAESVQIYVGRLAGEKTPNLEIWSKQISLAEKLLIFAHAPAYNSQNINSIRNEKELYNLHILNWANHRDLMPEISGARWTSKYDDMKYELYEYH